MVALRIVPIVLLASACTTLRPVDSPTAYLERNNPDAVRIYTETGLTVLRGPRLEGSTISGFDLIEGEDAAIAVSGIRRMEAKQFDKGRTTMLIAGLSVLGGVGIYMAANGFGGAQLYCDNYDVANRCQTKPPAKPAIPLGIRLGL